MKATFICELAIATAGLLGAGACVALELPPSGQDEDEGESETGDCEGEGCDPTHELSGELILFVNARLSDEGSSFQTHLPLDGEGTYLGNALYLYDPSRECDDGGNGCRVAKVGHLRLDASLGQASVDDKSLRKFVVRDLAWHPQRGLWAASFDTLNDEWSLSSLGVEDWSRRDNEIAVERWVIQPGPAESPSTDPCYWFEGVSGLGFAGDELLLGVRGQGSKGLITDGSLFRVDLEVFEQGHCVYAGDTSQDPLYYACDVVCEQWCDFGENIGVAGDVIEDPEGVGASAWLRGENEAAMPMDRNEMHSCVAPDPGEVASSAQDNIYLDEVLRGDEIDGLARVGGQLFGLSVLGKVYRIDEELRTVELIDDLEPLFPDQGLRLRGATEVLVPAP